MVSCLYTNKSSSSYCLSTIFPKYITVLVQYATNLSLCFSIHVVFTYACTWEKSRKSSFNRPNNRTNSSSLSAITIIFHEAMNRSNLSFVSKLFFYWARIFFLIYHLHNKWRDVKNIFPMAFMYVISLSVTIIDGMCQSCINDIKLPKHQLKLSSSSASKYANAIEKSYFSTCNPNDLHQK